MKSLKQIILIFSLFCIFFNFLVTTSIAKDLNQNNNNNNNNNNDDNSLSIKKLKDIVENLIDNILKNQFHVQNGKCEEKYSCKSVGRNCAGEMVYGIGPVGCSLSKGNCCGSGLKCVNGVCQSNDFGKKCRSDNECRGETIGSMISGCIRGKCKPLFNALEKCETDEHCYGSMKCVSGRCEPGNLGEDCTPPMFIGDQGVGGQTCDFGLVCERQSDGKGICKHTKGKNQPCSHPGECRPGHFCDVFTKTCMEMFSKEKGEQCTFGKACEKGLICDVEASHNATCSNPVDEPKMKKCKNNDDCDRNKNEYCACSYYTGESYCLPATGKYRNVLSPRVYSKECSKKVQEAIKCYEKHKCTSFLPSLHQNSCAKENCGTETEILLGCDTCDAMAERTFGDCYSKRMRDTCQNRHRFIKQHGPIGWWAAGIAIGCLLVGAVLVAVVIALGVAIRRRRRTGYIPVQ